MSTAGTPRIVYWNNIPSPYFVRRMNLLQSRGIVDVEVWFNDRRTPDRSWSVDERAWNFRHRYLPAGPAARIRAVASALIRRRPNLMVGLYENAAFTLGLLSAKTIGVPIVIHAMRTFPSWRARGIFREGAKHCLFRLADGVQVSGPDSAAYVGAYGAARNRTFVIREEIDLAGWSEQSELVSQHRDEIRYRLGLSGCVFLYVGRLVPEKGVGHLLEAFRELERRTTDVTLALVGDGSHLEAYRSMAQDIPGVVFSFGFVEGRELAQWYGAADALVFPTLGDPYGHVVQEAMAVGLPVVTSSTAGDITDRVIDGVTGFIVPPADPGALRDRMQTLADDAVLRRSLGAAGQERVQAWDSQTWAERFEEMVLAIAEPKAAR
jgi:glycosyltransferase involved in cell wall biosynthesis